MKKQFIKILTLFVSVFIFPILLFGKTEVPSSPRSVNAIKKVRPKLERELNKKGLSYGSSVFIRIFKKTKELEVWLGKGDKFRLFRIYKICTYGSGNLGPKLRRGDGQAPEGFYFVPSYRMNPESRFHLSFNIGYPNKFDRTRKRTGSALMVHGKCVSIGCYAMTDNNIEEIYALADAAFKNGQSFFRIHIFPFRMTQSNLDKYKKSGWSGFWKNLKEGYDFFEDLGKPPDVDVKNKHYIFRSS